MISPVDQSLGNQQESVANSQQPLVNLQDPLHPQGYPETNPQQTYTNPQQPYTNLQQPCTNPQQPCTNPQQTYTNLQQPCINPQQPCTNPQQTYTNPQQTCTNPQQTCTNPQQTCTNPQQPLINSQQTPTNPPQIPSNPQQIPTNTQQTSDNLQHGLQNPQQLPSQLATNQTPGVVLTQPMPVAGNQAITGQPGFSQPLPSAYPAPTQPAPIINIINTNKNESELSNKIDVQYSSDGFLRFGAARFQVHLCGCFYHPWTCLFTTFFCWPYLCYLSTMLGEGVCLPLCVPILSVATMRTKSRMKIGMPGSVCADGVYSALCTPCVMCQVRHLHYIATEYGDVLLKINGPNKSKDLP